MQIHVADDAHARLGVFPMVVNFWMALGSTIYIFANCCVLYYFRHPGYAFMCSTATPRAADDARPCFDGKG
jgi:hypothetical protein